MDDSSGTAEIVGAAVGGAVSAWMTKGIAKPQARAVSGEVVPRRESMDQQIIRGIERAFPGGVAEMVERIAENEQQRPRLLPLLGQIARSKAGEGASDREFELKITLGKAPEGRLTAEEMRDSVAAFKEEVGRG